MWRERYVKEFKYSQPNMFITAVCAFPNMHDTVDKVKEYYQVEENQKDPIRMEICALGNINAGRNFIPLYFEDQEPKLLDFKIAEDFGYKKGWFWCVAYRSPCYIQHYSKSGEETGASINYPKHKVWREYLEHSLSNLNGYCSEFLFTEAVMHWIYEQTAHWGQRDKSRRFQLIQNTSLECLSCNQFCFYKLEKERYIEFLDNMYERDIYEFIFHEFKTQVR